MEYIVNMDSEDWSMLIGYFMLNDKVECKPSEKQKELLELSERFIRDNQYSDDADSIRRLLE